MELSAIEPEVFAADVYNSVCDYCDDGVDAFEKCLEEAPNMEPQVLQQIQQGIKQLHADLSARVDCSFSLFDQVCKTSVLNAPTMVVLPQITSVPAVPMLSGEHPEGTEQQLESRVADLRRQLQKIEQATSSCRVDMQHIDQEVSSCGDMTMYKALATAASDNRESIKAIAQAAQKLQPLLERAQQVRNATKPRDKADVLGELKYVANSKLISLEAVQSFEQLTNS